MNGPSGMHQMFWHSMGYWMFLWWIFIIVATAGVASFFFRQRNTNKEKSALDVLKERYARGEITKQEFEEKKRDVL